MESKKDIYNLWVQYTTKNQETFFRQFVSGFVSIWESQLSLDVSNPPSLTGAKSDTGPHLSRLPDELLAAIGKFLYIAKEYAEKNPLTTDFLLEVELLVKCLTVIARNFDNITFIASCDYVSQGVAISSVVIHKLLDNPADPIDGGESFIKSFCRMLEVIYDPYFTWRHFLLGNIADFSKLQHQPALLHVEVIPFIYDCFQSLLMFSFPKLSTDLLHVLGAVIFGAQRMIMSYVPPRDSWDVEGTARRLSEGHNGLRAICPATASIVMGVISKHSVNQCVRETALKCFVAMVHVLHRSSPDQRQIELTTIVQLYMDAIKTFISSHSEYIETNSENNPEAVETNDQDTKAVCSIVSTIKVLLSDTPSTVTIAQTLVDTNFLALLISLPVETKEWCIEHQALAADCVSSISSLIQKSNAARDRMEKQNSYDSFISILSELGNPSRQLLTELLEMARGDQNIDPEDSVINNPNVLVRLITWMEKMSMEDQEWISEEIYNICNANLPSKTIACDNKTIQAVCETLSNPDVISMKAATDLIRLLENLARHSISVYELKLLFLLLRPEEDLPYRFLLLQALSAIARHPSPQCHSYIDMQKETDGISVPEIRKWVGSAYGFSFHCWLRLDSLPDTGVQNYRRQLFNLLTPQGTGMEVFIQRDGTLVVAISTRREFLSAVVPSGSAVGSSRGLLDNQWHCLTVCLAPPRRPFAHNNISVFIDGVQRLAVTMKFQAFSEPFSYCTIGSVVHRVKTPQQTDANGKAITDSDKGMLPSIIDKSFLPSFVSQVPSYFTLPLRTSSPLDPQVRSFPAGMQDSVWGSPCCLKGQLGLACLFQEPMSSTQSKTLHEAGPQFRMLLSNDEGNEGSELTARLVFCFSPNACWDGLCIDLAPGHKYSGHVVANHCHTQHIQDVINGIGGVHSLLPLLEFAGRENDGPDLGSFAITPTDPVESPSVDDLVDWEVLPSNAYTEWKLDQNPVAMFLCLLRNITSSHELNQEQLLNNEGVSIIGALLVQCRSSLIDVNVLMAIQLLVESSKDHHNPTLLKSLYQNIVFNFKIWSRSAFHIRIGHIQYISSIIKEDRKYFRKKFGIQFFLDTIREFYTSYENLSLDDAKTIRVSLLGIVKFYVQKELNVKEVQSILCYMSSVREELLLMEMIEMLLSHMESKHCKDQIFLLMYEPQGAELLYALLQDRAFSMGFKQKLLKFLYVLLRTDRINPRHKLSLRLQDPGGGVGMYPGLIALLDTDQLIMEVSVMLLDQMLLGDSEGSYAGALALLHSLALADIDVKLEMARKLLQTTFINLNAPFLIAKQVGWQDSITRLLIKRPISSPILPPSDPLLAAHSTDLMTFDETSLQLTEHSLNKRLSTQVTVAANVLEHEIKELAGSVGGAVADNLHSVAGNISSVYSALRQKTSDLQDIGIGLMAGLDLGQPTEVDSTEASPQTAFPPGETDTSIFWGSNHSGSSSSTEDLSSMPGKRTHLDSVSMSSVHSNHSTSIREGTPVNDVYKQLHEDRIVDKEDNLCYLVSNILFTVLWRGVEGATKESWKERGQVMACINLLGLNNELYCSHLQLKLRILEMGVQASLLDLGDGASGPAIAVHQENAAQLMRMVFDLVVLDPNEDDSKKCSVKLLDGVLALLDALLVFQDSHGEDWGEMARLSLGLLVRCTSHPSSELVAMATAKLHALLHTRRVTDVKEAAYIMYKLNSTLQSAIEIGNSEQYSFLMPVMKALLDKTRLVLSLNIHTPDLPQTSAGPVFFNDFQMYCTSYQWTSFIDKKIKPQHDAYLKEISSVLTEPLNTFWAECYEATKVSAIRRARDQQESRQRFQGKVIAPWKARQAEEAARLAALTAQHRSHDLLVERRWRRTRQFLMGPRGPWRQKKLQDTHWNLSHHENVSRMRLKLEPALHFDPHTTAASLRDNTGQNASARKHSVEFSLPITPAARRSAVEDEEGVPEEELRLSAEPQLELKETGKEKIVISQECELITLMTRVKGRLDVTTTHLVFHDLSPIRDDAERQDFRWNLSELKELHLRKYNLRRSALEIFLLDQTNYFLNFSTKTRNKVFSRILSLQPPNILYGSGRSPAELLRASGLTQRWQCREISNFDYLMQLNTIAGRTYNDLSQYPVFPWILADYQSDILDLSNPSSFRDLSKPVGVVNPKNEAEVRNKFESFEDPTGTISKFHYGTHYSNSAGVLHYLLRVEPFTSLHIELQSGRFDVADRQFHSIPQTWKLLMDNPNDVKELTPEFFYFPEFLKNMNKFDLGHLQITKERVDDVVLPKWSANAEEFIALHRRALESEYVSAHIHEWIDLIFGYKQKGPKAVEALNVFYYCSYEGAVDLDAITNPMEREAVEGMINNFGQTPSQLLRDAHPKRLSIDEVVNKMLRAELRRPDITMFLDRVYSYTIEMTSDKDPVVFLSVPRSPPRTFLQAGPDCLVSISKSGVLGAHSWLPQDKASQKGFLLDVDPTLNNPKTRRKLAGPFHPSLTLDSQLFAVSLDGRLLYSGGLWDSSLRVYSATRARVVASVIRHFDVITCVALDNCGSYLVTGSKDCTCVLWTLNNIANAANNVPPRALHTLYGHDNTVTCVSILTELDMVVSGSQDGTVNVYTIKDGQFIRCLKPAGCVGPRIEVSFVALSPQGHVAFSAKDQTSHSVHVFSVNGTSLGSKYVSGRVTGLAIAGDNLVVADDAGDLTMSRLQGLKPVFDIPLHVPIQSVVVTPGNSHVLCPLRDGRLAVLGPPVVNKTNRTSVLNV